MSSNGVNNADEADITECDGEKVVTMMDVLQEQQEFEEDANAVLGASDDKECTYSEGYIKRQAIYACLTCCSEAKDDPTQRAGVCLACSLNCHENHELIELYTKRNFRCDCGNPKFKSHPCQFTPNKSELNEDNDYNQNFSGIYCVCNRPYPDPEATDEDDMIQCTICEDWLHSSHLEAVIPHIDLYAEMICKACMDKNYFLHDYSHFAVNYEQDVYVNVVDTEKNGDDTSIHLVNGKLDTSDTAHAKMEIENRETELNENSAATEENTTTDKKTDCTAESSEKLQLEGNSTVPMDCEENTTPDELETKDTKEIGNKETQPNINTSVATYSLMDTGAAQNKIDDNNMKIEKLSPEQDKSITKHILKPIDTLEKDNTKSLEDNSSNACNKESEMNKACDNVPKDVEQQHAVSSDTLEVTNQSEQNDNVSDQVPENINTIATSKQTNDVAKDSLEAATKELSDLMDDGQQTRNHSEMEPKAAQNSTAEPAVKENGFSNEAINGDKHTDSLNNINIAISTDNDNKRRLNDTTEEVSIKKQKVERNDYCRRPRNVKRTINGAAFWPSNFRQKLCICNECQTMYKDLSVLFLVDPEDTVTAYETLGKERIDGEPATQYEKGLQALSSLDRVQQINALTEYNRMRDKLLDFLKSFKDRREVVKEEDIKAFFAGMKPRREPDGVYFCK